MERRRGRPPHPDILTPREWEVLALLRQSLSNEQIAERLDISVPGVKYHVSEILSKLHVSSREEAAAWQPEQGRRRAWLALPLGAKIAAGAITLATIAAIVVLAYGVAQTGSGEPDTFAPAFDLDDLQPGDDPERDLVLLDSRVPGDIARIMIRPSTGADAETEFDFVAGTPLDNVIGWLIVATTWSETYPGFVGGPAGRPDPPPGCYEKTVWTNAGEPATPNIPETIETAALLDDSECTVETISRDTAIAIAGSAEFRSRNADTTPPLTGATTLGAAIQALVDAGFNDDGGGASSDTAIWLVMYTGPVIDPNVPTPAPVPGQPSPAPRCSRVATSVDASTGDVLLSQAIPVGPC